MSHLAGEPETYATAVSRRALSTTLAGLLAVLNSEGVGAAITLVPDDDDRGRVVRQRLGPRHLVAIAATDVLGALGVIVVPLAGATPRSRAGGAAAHVVHLDGAAGDTAGRASGAAGSSTGVLDVDAGSSLRKVGQNNGAGREEASSTYDCRDQHAGKNEELSRGEHCRWGGLRRAGCCVCS